MLTQREIYLMIYNRLCGMHDYNYQLCLTYYPHLDDPKYPNNLRFPSMEVIGVYYQQTLAIKALYERPDSKDIYTEYCEQLEKNIINANSFKNMKVALEYIKSEMYLIKNIIDSYMEDKNE